MPKIKTSNASKVKSALQNIRDEIA